MPALSHIVIQSADTAAFTLTMPDPDFLADTKKLSYDAVSLTGEEGRALRIRR